MMKINLILLEKKTNPQGITKLELKKKIPIKKPETLLDLKKFLISQFSVDKPNCIRIYSIDWTGEANEIKDEDDFQADDNNGFKCIYDEDNPIIDDEDNEDIEEEKKKEEDQNEDKESIDMDELEKIIDDELKDEKEEKNLFNSKIFCDELFNKFEELQNTMINDTKLQLDKGMAKMMVEQSKVFYDFGKFPKIQESILKTTKIIFNSSKINKKNVNEPKGFESLKIYKKRDIPSNIDNTNSSNLFKIENEEEKDEYDFKFLNQDIQLVKTPKDAKWITIEKIQFQNIGKTTFTGGDLYFYKGEGSSEELYFSDFNKNDKKFYICLEDDLIPTGISPKIDVLIRNEELLMKDNYNLNLFIKSDKKEIKMKNPLRINIKIIKDNYSQSNPVEQLNEKLEKERLKNAIKEKLEREEKEKKEKEEKERNERLERERKEREERERREKEEKERFERLERERKEREEKERNERLERERKEREERERKEREEKERKEREERERKEREERERKEREEKERNERLERERREEKERKEREEREKKEKEEKEQLEAKIQEIFENLENNFQISSLKPEDEVKAKIKELNCEEEQIKAWAEALKGQNNPEQENIEAKTQQIYDRLEEDYYISSFKPEEEVKEKIKDLNFDEDQINAWVESIM